MTFRSFDEGRVGAEDLPVVLHWAPGLHLEEVDTIQSVLTNTDWQRRQTTGKQFSVIISKYQKR